MKAPWSHPRIFPDIRPVFRLALICALGVTSVMMTAAHVGAQVPADAPAASAADVSENVYEVHGDHGWFATSRSDYRSPGLAAALSLIPVPIDFGNLYAENVGWGIVYTATQVTVATPLIWLTARHMGWRHHQRTEPSGWTVTERRWAWGLLAGYVGIKLISATHAAFAARAFNEAHQTQESALTIAPMETGLGAIWRLQY